MNLVAGPLLGAAMLRAALPLDRRGSRIRGRVRWAIAACGVRRAAFGYLKGDEGLRAVVGHLGSGGDARQEGCGVGLVVGRLVVFRESALRLRLCREVEDGANAIDLQPLHDGGEVCLSFS